MKYSESIKPISYFKNKMAHVIRQLRENQSTMIITQNGEARAVVMDVRKYEQMLETMAMLELIAQGKQDIAEGKFRPAQEVFRDLKKRISEELA